MEICELERVQVGGGISFQLQAHWLSAKYFIRKKSLLRDIFTATFLQYALKLHRINQWNYCAFQSHTMMAENEGCQIQTTYNTSWLKHSNFFPITEESFVCR